MVDVVVVVTVVRVEVVLVDGAVEVFVAPQIKQLAVTVKLAPINARPAEVARVMTTALPPPVKLAVFNSNGEEINAA